MPFLLSRIPQMTDVSFRGCSGFDSRQDIATACRG